MQHIIGGVFSRRNQGSLTYVIGIGIGAHQTTNATIYLVRKEIADSKTKFLFALMLGTI